MPGNDSVLIEYGNSATCCDFVLEQQLKTKSPSSIVDFGAGAGKNGRIIRKVLAGEPRVLAVEGYHETAVMLNSLELYDEVYEGLVQYWINEHLDNSYDFAIFGDVLEHLKPKEIRDVVTKAIKVFRTIVIVCPLHNIFQEDNYGNPLEVHKAYVTQSFFDCYNVTEKHIVKGGNWTIMNVLINTRAQRTPTWKRFFRSFFHYIMLILQPLGLARPFVNILKCYFRKYKWLLR